MSSQKEATLETYREKVRQCLRAAGPARELVLDRFRLAGGDMRRWGMPDLRLMAEAMTRTEDECEGKRGWVDGLRDVRRELEVSGW